MRKLVFGFAAVVGIGAAVSFMPKSTSGTRAALRPRNNAFSLNGITQDSVSLMVSNLLNNADALPANTQVWFSKAVVDSVCSQLHQDSVYFAQAGDTTAGIRLPDGVRFYFASVPATGSILAHQNNRIVVVSTFFNGVDSINQQIHKDYFGHSPKAGLLQMSSVSGKITHDNDTTNGAMLYYNCNCDTVGLCLYPSDHDIKRNDAEKMVQAFSGNSLTTRSEFFDIGLLKNLDAEMSREGDDGIRIYFARTVAGIPGVKPQDVGHARFIVTTTRTTADPNIHRDYFDCVHPPKGSLPYPLKGRGNPQNNGELCPTNCDGVTQP